MLSVFRNMFRIKDLRNKILFTLFIFAIYRLGTAIPVPGVDLDRVQDFATSQEQSGFVGILNTIEQFLCFARCLLGIDGWDSGHSSTRRLKGVRLVSVIR